MTPLDLDELQKWLCLEALTLIGFPDQRENEAYRAMASEPEFLPHWWSGIFVQDAAETALLDSAARAFAHGKPLPEISLAQRGRLALRLRLGSRILRTYGSRHINRRSKGWFPARLYKLSKIELLEWLLVDAWPICVEILDETLLWADEVEHPTAPSMKKSPPRPASSQDAASFSE
jgi:hypothetical protein